MISQNRADEKRQVIADQQWRTDQEEEPPGQGPAACATYAVVGRKPAGWHS